jgi:hypothetical protein
MDCQDEIIQMLTYTTDLQRVCAGASKDALRTAVFNFYRVAKVGEQGGDVPITEPQFYKHIAEAINCFLKGDDKIFETDTKDVFIHTEGPTKRAADRSAEEVTERPKAKHHTPWGSMGGDDEASD